MQLPEWLDGVQDPAEAKFAHKVMVPVLLGIVATTLGIGIARACCGINYRKYDPYNLLPISMAGLTSLMAVWSYFNPPPADARMWAKKAKSKGRGARYAAGK